MKLKVKLIKRAAALVLCTAVLSGSPMSIPTLEGSVGYTSTVFAAPKYTNRNVAVHIGDKWVEFKDQGPVIIDGRTFVPIRAVWDAIGPGHEGYRELPDGSWETRTVPTSVKWDADKKETTLWLGFDQAVYDSQVYHGYDNYENVEIHEPSDFAKSFNTTIKLVNGSKIMRVSRDGGKTWSNVEMPVAPVVINGRTLLPIRYPLEAIGFKVTWDPDFKYDGYNGCVVADVRDYDSNSSEAHTKDVREVRAYLEKTCSNKPLKDYTNMAELENEMLFCLNQVRIFKGLKPLERTEEEMEWARIRANEALIIFDHVRPNGNPADSEILCNTKSTDPVWETAAGFYNSLEHRQEMFGKPYNHTKFGVGIAIEPTYDVNKPHPQYHSVVMYTFG